MPCVKHAAVFQGRESGLETFAVVLDFSGTFHIYGQGLINMFG